MIDTFFDQCSNGVFILMCVPSIAPTRTTLNTAEKRANVRLHCIISTSVLRKMTYLSFISSNASITSSTTSRTADLPTLQFRPMPT